MFFISFTTPLYFPESDIVQHEGSLICVTVSLFKYYFLKSNIKLCEIKIKVCLQLFSFTAFIIWSRSLFHRQFFFPLYSFGMLHILKKQFSSIKLLPMNFLPTYRAIQFLVLEVNLNYSAAIHHIHLRACKWPVHTVVAVFSVSPPGMMS